jgi:hypothetical protein
MSPHAPDPLNDSPASWTKVAPLPPHRSGRQRQAVTRSLPGNSEIATRATPLGTMGLNATVACTFVGHQVCQLVQKRPLDFAL